MLPILPSNTSVLRALLIINRTSGVGQDEACVAELASLFQRELYELDEVRVEFVHNHADARACAARFSAASDAPALIVVGGGGGTLRGVVEGIYDSRNSAVRVGALRMGSGNLLARQFGTPRDPIAGLRSLLANLRAGRTTQSCVMRCETWTSSGNCEVHHGVVMGGLGQFGRIPRNLSRWHARFPLVRKLAARLLGVERFNTLEYVFAFLLRSLTHRAEEVEVHFNDQQQRLRLLSGIMMTIADSGVAVHLLTHRGLRYFYIDKDQRLDIRFANQNPVEFFLDEDPVTTCGHLKLSLAGSITFVAADNAERNPDFISRYPCLHVSVLGIDGSGKSTVAAALPGILAAETGGVIGSAGDSFRIVAPDEDHLASRFCPDGLPLRARVALKLKRFAKALVDHPKLYAVFKLAHLLVQDSAAKTLARRYGTALFVSDGNTLLSTAGRAANYLRETPDAKDLQTVFAYALRFNPVPLPDLVIFLDVSPQVALARIKARGNRIDWHENLADLARARAMYLKTLTAFQSYRTPRSVHVIRVDELSPGETLRAVSDALKPHLLSSHTALQASESPLGTTDLANETIRRKTINHRYFFRYLLAKWFSGAWREPTFFFSKLGRLFLKEGYSAGVMRAIYDRDANNYGLLDRVFLEYSLHRAVYDRLQILLKKIEPEIEARLAAGDEIHIFTAPSGFAYDVFRPLEDIARRDPQSMKRVHVTAADLDPHGVIAEELTARANRLGIRFTFYRGDITDQTLLAQLEANGPFDLALFVGLSAWLPKPQTLRHLAWLSKNLDVSGVLVTDCFTPAAYALSGRYIGYKANYYTPDVYNALLNYCGFVAADIESGRDAINHVLLAHLDEVNTAYGARHFQQTFTTIDLPQAGRAAV